LRGNVLRKTRTWSAKPQSKKAQTKIQVMAEILGCSETEASQQIFERTMAAMPNRVLPDYLLPSLRIASCERISEELIRLSLQGGRVFTGQRSNQKEYLLQQVLSRYLPPEIDGDAYKLALDVERRYCGTSLSWCAPEGGLFVEGGCFTGMRAIRWHDLAKKPIRIIAVEIGGRNAELLKTNIDDNGLTGTIIPVHAGLWRESGQGVQRHSYSTRRFLETTDRWKDHERHEEAVELLTLDNLLDAHDAAMADFVNLQVNGAEVEVLKGVGDWGRIKVISVAAYYEKDGVKNADLVETLLKEAGCTILQRSELGRVTAVTPQHRDEILALPTVQRRWRRRQL
jgi:FkbM family methyltransferase